MSTYSSYNSYLGNKSCCKTLCSLCITGVTGPTGPAGATGETGAAGATGAQGATGAIQPTPTLQQVLTAGNTGTDKDILLTNGTGITNTLSFNGLSSTGPMTISSGDNMTLSNAQGGMNVTCDGNLIMTSTQNIDITAPDILTLASTNDDVNINSGKNMTLTSATDINLTATTSLTGKIDVNATNGLVINQQGLTPPDTTITTLNGNIIEIFEDKNTSVGLVNQVLINTAELYVDNTDNTNQTDSYSRVSPNEVEIYDHTSSGTNASITKISSTTFDYNPSGTKPTFYQFTYEVSNIFRYDNTGIKMGSSGTGVQLNANNIEYPATYNAANASISTTSNAVQTFNGSSLTATLFNASATNVGTQFTITNTNATSLTVTTTGGTQLIYSSTGAASATSRSLASGHSHIFTAILTTGASTYGWSMV